MPIISVKVIKDFFTEEQKTALIPALTDAFCKATLEAARPYIYVTVEEVPQGVGSRRTSAARSGFPHQ